MQHRIVYPSSLSDEEMGHARGTQAGKTASFALAVEVDIAQVEEQLGTYSSCSSVPAFFVELVTVL